MRRLGLTLIELLVVIAIIALLMAIAIPCLRSSKQRADILLCGSNIKQLLVGLFMYETANERFPYALDTARLDPPPGGFSGYNQYDRMGWWWFNYIDYYFRGDTDSKTVLRCPSRKLKHSKFEDNILCGNYGINQSICKSAAGRASWGQFIGTPLRMTQISSPGRAMLIVDSGYSMITWWHAVDLPPIDFTNTIEDVAYIPGLKINSERDFWPGQEEDAIKGRHQGKTVNIGFADGHVSRTKADTLLVERKTEYYKNLSPLWLPK